MPGAQLHFLAIDDFDRCLLNSLLVTFQLLRAPMRANLVVLPRLLFIIVLSTLLGLLSQLFWLFYDGLLLLLTANIAAYLVQLCLHIVQTELKFVNI